MGRELHTIHPSMRHHVIRRVPAGFSSALLSRDKHEALSEIALETFTSCINVGMPMQDALLAIYLTGLENGHEASKEAAQ